MRAAGFIAKMLAGGRSRFVAGRRALFGAAPARTMSDAEPFVPIRGLHHYAYRCRDCEETRAFYEDVLGLPLVHVIRADVVPSTGEHCPYVHVFFRMADGSHLAFFDLGDNVAAEPSPNTPAWVNHIALRVDSIAALARCEGAPRSGRRRGPRHHRPPHHRVDLLLRPERHPPRADGADGERRDDGARTRARRTPRSRRGRARSRRASPARPTSPRQAGSRVTRPARSLSPQLAWPRSPTGARWMPELRRALASPSSTSSRARRWRASRGCRC